MHNLYLLVLCALPAFSPASAHFSNENPRPHAPYYKYPPGTPSTMPEPIHTLEQGQRYADPQNNPFNAPNAFIYGPTKVVELGNFTRPEVVDFNKTCRTGGYTLEVKWAMHLQEILYRNRTVQQVGFQLDTFNKSETMDGSILSEITRARQIQYGGGCEKDEWQKSHTHHTKLTSKLEKKELIGADTRDQILNTWLYPYNTVGHVGRGCTGTLIGPHHVITAGHCVHSGGAAGKWFQDIDFTLTYRPGIKNQTFSEETFAWERVWSTQGWTQHRDFNYDFALIILSDRNMNKPWMSFGYNTGLAKHWYMNANGYPGDKPDSEMWHSFESVADATGLWFDHNLDLVPGNSGSSIYRYRPEQGERIVHGIHSNHWTDVTPNVPDFWNSHVISGNRAVNINKPRFQQICGWMGEGIC